MEKDIFCKISNKEEKAFIIAENANALAFLSIRPATRGHILVVPKKHYNDVFDVDNQTWVSMLELVKEVGKKLLTKLYYEGVSILSANGEKAQEIRHFHLHVYGTNTGEKKHYYKGFEDTVDLQSDLASVHKELTK